jgi:hypothetical protein
MQALKRVPSKWKDNFWVKLEEKRELGTPGSDKQSTCRER